MDCGSTSWLLTCRDYIFIYFVIEKFKYVLFGLCCSLSTTTTSNEYDHQDFIPSIPCHAIFVFLDPILLGVLQVEFQNKKESPLDTHAVHKQTFLTAICIYSALLGIQIHTHTRGGGGYLQAQILSYALLFSGTLSSASLLSITLQQRLLWVVLFVWGSIPLILARHFLKSLVLLLVAKLNRGVRNCMLAIVVLIFHNKDSSSNGSNNTTYPTRTL